jgi:hypothetical protein
VTAPVVGLVAAYGAVTMLLLSLNLTSLWRWWVKAAAIIITTVFFGVTYNSVNGLMGWPTTQKLPPRFNFVSSHVTEPDRRTQTPGHIYVWANELDVNNVPSGAPRSYQLDYSDTLARKITGAQEKRDQGLEVMGLASDSQLPKRADPRSDIKLGQIQDNKGQQSPATDTVPFREDGDDISFEDLPPVILPDKGPL